MRSKVLRAAAVVVALAATAFGWRSFPRAIASDACGTLPHGARLMTVEAGRLTDGHGHVALEADTAGSFQARHVASSPAGVAYVRDRVGRDDVVVSAGGSRRVLPQQGEAMHPAWGPNGRLAWGVDDDLAVMARSGRVRTIPGPLPGGMVIAPAFEGRGLVAAVAAGPTAVVPEDEWSDDLWRLSARGWRRVTHFPAGPDRWTAIRTPMTAPDGSVRFVVVAGRASATGIPRFSLWQLADGRAVRLRSLPGEMYLAGFDGGGRPLWNVPDRANERWLVRDDSGTLVGCGAVAVDPIDGVDPDRTGHAAPARDATIAQHEIGDPVEVALLVGDFASKTAAAVVADRLTNAYHGAVPIDLLEGGASSAVLAPGAWGVVVRLGAATDGGPELAGLRALVPDLAGHTWIVVP
jgi:hypothetical protein